MQIDLEDKITAQIDRAEIPHSLHDLLLHVERINGKLDIQSFNISSLEKSFSKLEERIDDINNTVNSYAWFFKFFQSKMFVAIVLGIVVFTLSHEKFANDLLNRVL